MNTRTAVASMLLACGLAHAAGPVIDIPPATLPDEAFFAANPDATVNVSGGELIFPDADDGTFTFNGATVNIEPTGGSGFFTVDHFVEDVTYNINGGELVRAKFVGGAGATVLNINSGSVERGLWLQGTTTGFMTGGTVGAVAGGQAALVVEDSATFDMSDGFIDTFIVVTDDASVEISGGDIDGALQLSGDAHATVSGGSTGADGFMDDVGNTLDITGGTVGDAFVMAHGVATMSSGAMGDNSALGNSGGVDAVFTMTGGALGSLFRCYDGTINISGGVVGDRFRCGRPTGDGSGATCNLIVKSATLAGVPLTLSTTPTVIADRSGAFLSCVMLDDSVVGFILNESSGTEDYFRAAAVLTIALGPCTADCDGSGTLNVDDIDCYIAAFIASDLGLGDCDANGVLNIDDVDCFVTAFLAGCP